ncbi:MAG: MFS transporter, partial [Candidatus Aenigmatarchaeota archaeon]
MADFSFRSNIWKMYLMNLLRGLHFFGGVLIPFFTDWAHLSYTQIMILQSWFMFWAFALEIPTGTVADYFGRRASIALGCFTWAAGALIYVSYPSFYVFMLGEFIFAIGAALISGADQALIYDSLKQSGEAKRSKSVFGRYASMGMLGILIASPVGGFLGSIDLRLPMLITSVPLALAGVLMLLVKEPYSAKKMESTRYLNVLKEGLRFFAKNRAIKILAIDMAFVGAITYTIIWFFQIMLKNAGVPITYFGFVHAAMVLAEIIVLNNFGRLKRLFGSKRNFLIASTLIPGIMFVVAGTTTSLPVILLSILLIGGFGLTRSTLIQHYMNKHMPTARRATILSAASMLANFAIAAMDPFAG